jgi:hypothetical protein
VHIKTKNAFLFQGKMKLKPDHGSTGSYKHSKLSVTITNIITAIFLFSIAVLWRPGNPLAEFSHVETVCLCHKSS